MNNRPPKCKAYVEGQQWFCDQCQYTWDMDDDEPPKCDVAAEPIGTHVDHGAPSRDKEKAHQAVNDMRNIFNNKGDDDGNL